MVVDHGAEVFSGAQEASLLPSVGRKGATPDISTVQLCGGTVETGEDGGSEDGGSGDGGTEDGGPEDGGSGDGGSGEDDLPVAV